MLEAFLVHGKLDVLGYVKVVSWLLYAFHKEHNIMSSDSSLYIKGSNNLSMHGKSIFVVHVPVL